MNDNNNNDALIALVIYGLIILVNISIFAAVIYAVIHFMLKFW